MLRIQIEYQWQMHSPVLRCFVDASGLRRFSLPTSNLFSPCHITNAVPLAYFCKWRHGFARRKTIIVSSGISQRTQRRNYSAALAKVSFNSDLPASSEELSRRRLRPNKWIALLEPYLPPDLRNDPYHGGTQNAESIHNVASIVSKARERLHGGLDLLSYLGVCQKRWRAVIWLVKALSRSYPHHFVEKQKLETLQAPQWKCDLDLETLTDAPIWADDIVKPLSYKFSLKSLDNQNRAPTDRHKIDLDREIIGQIWQSVACMIIQAADYPLGHSQSKIIMSHVLEILAHLHHIDSFPPSIYQYNPPADRSVPHKPPTLSLLSSQIMTILSDTAWRAREAESASETMPYEMSKDNKEKEKRHWIADVELRLPELSHGIWLELILWSCIEMGWISEATWIVGVINKRSHDPSLRWSVIRWDSISYQEAPKMGWNMRLYKDYQLISFQHIFGRISGVGIGENPISIDMHPRTLSREVIMVLIDGIINYLPNPKKRKYNIRKAQESILICESLLNTEGQEGDPEILDSVVLRLLDLEGSAVLRTPDLLEEVLRLSSKEFRLFAAPSWFNGLADEGSSSNSAIRLGLIHQLLYSFARVDLVHGALKSFKMTQSVIDIGNRQRLKHFLTSKTQPTQMGDQASLEQTDTSKFEIRQICAFPLPGHVLVAFLEFIMRAELWELGKWLFYSDDVDGPLIHSKLYSDDRLQSVFLRFATATADAQMMIRVTESFKAPLSQPILRALLHCQVAVDRWSSVQDLLIYFRDEPGMSWDASDAMSIATGILRMERSNLKADDPNSADISLAFSILQRLISGEFNSANSRTFRADVTQYREMIQIGRILRKIPGKLSTLKSKYFGCTERFCAPVDISVEAFNLLMKCLVDCRGCVAGKELWDMWCRGVGPTYRRLKARHNENSEVEPVIDPNLQTLRIVLQPIIIQACVNAADKGMQVKKTAAQYQRSTILKTDAQGLQTIENIDVSVAGLEHAIFLPQPQREVLQWGLRMYRKFGLTEEDLGAEISRHLVPQSTADESVATSEEVAVLSE